jgi:hypothetical protein
MLPDQNIGNLSELQEIFSSKSSISNKIVDVFKGFKVCKVLNSINKYKVKGYEALGTLSILLLLPFVSENSINSLVKSPVSLLTEMEKDVFYRLKNKPDINWRDLLYSIAKRSMKIINKSTILPDEPSEDIIFKVKCLVFDDTIIRKTGFTIEGVGKVFDHVFNEYVLGFKMLCSCFWDGKSLNPLDFSLHSERGKEKPNKPFHPFGLTKKQLKERYHKKRNSTTPGFQRKKELSKSKITVLLEMLKKAVDQGFIPKYVLMDKWFISEEVIKTIRQLKKGSLHILAACKKDKRKYEYKGKAYTASELLDINKDKMKHCRTIKSHYIKVCVEYKNIPMILYFNKPCRRRNWELLITTDLKLSFIDAMKIYRIRWGIEVFFKECKQHLHLGKCQSQDFDAQISDTTLSMIRYILLNQYKRFSDYETLGEVFTNTRIFTLKLTIGQRLWFFFLEICRQICELFEMDEELFMEKLFSFPEFEKKVFYFFDECNKLPNLTSINNANAG